MIENQIHQRNTTHISMKNNLLFLYLLFTSSAFLCAQSPKTPSDFLGYELGEEFSYHHEMVNYFKHVAETSAKVSIEMYGQTYERRPLMVAYVSSEENIQNLAQIRENNLIASGLKEGEIKGKQLPIIWLSYNVHGNESVSMEAAMKVLYSLISNQESKAEEWLQNVVVVIDPCENPDGRERYATFYNGTASKTPNPDINHWSHRENWPNGRVNHYCFDLNRDWAWQTQIESQARTKLYQTWMPQIHVDLHEMGINSPYFFPPSVEPFHPTITQWQRDFHQLAGKSHAKYFNKNGWLYYTNQVFDLFYPSYGDTWPTFNGAIGFTYEQGGSGQAGLAVKTAEGDTLTLKDRIDHHYASSISTIEVSYENRERLLEEFNKYFTDGLDKPSGKYKSYIISSENSRSSLKSITQLLDKQSIKYGYINSNMKGKSASGFDYLANSTGNFSLSEKDIVISAHQAKHHFVEALFDPKPELSDSLTYDMTAWALPYVYGVKAYASTQKMELDTKPVTFSTEVNPVPKAEPAYAYLATWKDASDVKFLSDLLQNNIRVRFNEVAFEIDGVKYDAGTLIITRLGNENFSKGFDQTIIDLANKHQKKITPSYTGLVTNGKDFGSNDVKQINMPKVAIMAGNGIGQTNFGEAWYYFEQVIDYPVSVIKTDYAKYVNLNLYDILVLPSGNYTEFKEKLSDFVKDGGKLIMLDRSVSALTGSNLKTIQYW